MAARIHLAGSSDRKAFGFQEQSPLSAQVPVCPERNLPFGQFLELGFSIYAGGFFNLPHPPTVPGLKTSGSTKGSFFSPHYRADFFLPEPQGQGSLRPIFGSGWRFGILPAPSSAAIFRRSGAKHR